MNTKIATLISCLVLVGCTTPVSPGAEQPPPRVPVVFTVEAALEYLEALTPAVETQQLYWISGSEYFADFNAPSFADGVSTEWQYGYRDGGKSTIYTVTDNGTIREVRMGSWLGAGLASAPLALNFTQSSHTLLQEAIDAMGPLLPSPGLGDELDYWLSSLGGVPIWTVIFRDVDGAVVRSLVNPINGTVTVGGVATPGFVNPLAPDVSLNEVIAYANETALLWAPDARLIEAEATESAAGGLSGFEASRFWDHGPVIVPPDTMPGDGRAPLWVMTYHSSVLDSVLSVATYSTSLAVPGNALPAGLSDPIYQESYVPTDFVNSTELASHIVESKRTFSGYNLSGTRWTAEWYWQEYLQIRMTVEGNLTTCPEYACQP